MSVIDLKTLPQIVAAIRGLGIAAFGLVAVSKVVFPVNHIGFGGLERTVKSLTPGSPTNALSQDKIIATLKANWSNGSDLGGQKSNRKVAD